MNHAPQVPLEEEQSKPSFLKRTQAFLTQKIAPFFSHHGYLLLCMAVPAILVYLIYFAREIHPFGDSSVLTLDLNGQYVWFFEGLRNFVHGDADLLYTFSRALGGEFLGLYAYYLASPLSYLVCLFPEGMMLEALLCLFLLKASLCGLTFGIYMKRSGKSDNKFAIVLFAAFYALSSYAIVQQHNTMWIDALMWLPMITLGIESIIKHGKFKLYVISLSIALFSNYYIGYMLCLWCFIYFFVYYIAHAEDGRNNPCAERFHFLRSVLRMALYSILSIGIAAFIILAAYYSLNFGKTTFSNPDWIVAGKFDLLDFFYKLLPGSYDTVRPEGLPFVYCGILTLLLVPVYFLSKKFSLRQKILSAVLILILFFSCAINVTDLIWHGFQAPNWLNYRYSFMICFYLCVLACRAFSDFEALSLKPVLFTGGAIVILCVVLQKYTNGEYVDPKDFACIYFSILLVFLYVCILTAMKRKAFKLNTVVLRAILCAVIATELFLNGLFCLNALEKDVGYGTYSSYNDFLDNTRPIVEMVQESDDSFYRMEKTFFRKTNDNMALGIRGLSGSTSTLNKETIKFLNKMGYSSKSHWSKYLGGTPVNDSLLGLKYIISDNTIYQNYYAPYKTDPNTGYVAYYNPYALSIAYGVSDDVLDFPLGFLPLDETEDQDDKKKEEDPENEDKVNMDGISNAVQSLKSKLNKLFGIEETNGEEYEDAYNSPFERLNAIVTAMLGEEETVQIFVPLTDYDVKTKGVTKKYYSGGEHGYLNNSTQTNGTVTYTVDIPTDAELFFNLPTNYPREVSLALSVNDADAVSWGTFNGNETARIISLGMRNEDDEVALTMTISNDSDALYILTKEYCFYYIDWAVFEDAMARLATDQFIIEDYTEKSFDGTFTASREHELVLTTIPYDNGWKVFVDGKQVETQKALGALVSFYVDGDAGEAHEITMVYDPPIIRIGFWISMISILIFAALIVIDRFVKLGCRDRGKRVIVPDSKNVSNVIGESTESDGQTENKTRRFDPIRILKKWKTKNRKE
ncbi:MAG: YfhO family protein [Clostridia bacterium]|nr:YfhO family protein [Clostridia bacterium]